MEKNTAYVLLGSRTSPFVRRIRMLLHGLPHELKDLNIYETDGALELHKVNPINQVPALIDGEHTIWDSRVIFNYLNSLHRFQNMDWNDENVLTAIDGAMNAGVSMALMKRSGINIDDSYMYVVRLKDRIESVLDYLRPYIEGEALAQWNFHTMSLYSFFDWGLFRNLMKLDHRPECIAFMNHYKNHPSVTSTEIPRT